MRTLTAGTEIIVTKVSVKVWGILQVPIYGFSCPKKHYNGVIYESGKPS